MGEVQVEARQAGREAGDDDRFDADPDLIDHDWQVADEVGVGRIERPDAEVRECVADGAGTQQKTQPSTSSAAAQ